jgi:hypothetical protein
MWISRASYEGLKLEHARLRDEVGYLRGQLAETRKAGGETVEAVERIVEKFVGGAAATPASGFQLPDVAVTPGMDPEDLMDWTDGVMELPVEWPSMGDDEGFVIDGGGLEG